MGIDHGGLDIFMAHQFLDRPDIIAVLQQVGGKTVPKRMARPVLGDPALFDRRLDPTLQILVLDMMPPYYTGPGIC